MGWGDGYRGWGSKQPSPPLYLDELKSPLEGVDAAVRRAFGNGGQRSPSGNYGNPYMGWGARRGMGTGNPDALAQRDAVENMQGFMQPGALSAPPIPGTLENARAQEIAYANSMAPAPGSMEAARAQEIAYANSQPNPAAPRPAAPVPMPPPRPAEMQPALYYVDRGDGSPILPMMSQDGSAPVVDGATVFKDEMFNPKTATGFQKFMRGILSM